MAEDNEQDVASLQEWQDGFNYGYTLEKYLPGTAADIATALQDENGKAQGDQADGFLSGREEYRLEQLKERRPEWLREPDQKDNPQSHEPQRDQDKDIEHDR